MRTLSVAAMSLWGKKGKPGEMTWLPLAWHMADAANTASRLWANWLPASVRNRIERSLIKPHEAEQLLRFLAAAHDLGKATPVFQSKTRGVPPVELDNQLMDGLLAAGLPCDLENIFLDKSATPHALATELLLRQRGCDPGVAAILGAHHGRPASSETLRKGALFSHPRNYHMGTQGKAAWTGIQQELLAFALRTAGYAQLDQLPRPDFMAQLLLVGLVTMTDWIASNEHLFPYQRWEELLPLGDDVSRADRAWRTLNLPKGWQRDELAPKPAYYIDRFSIDRPYPMQEAVEHAARGIAQPGIFILEAPMGSGKTEAALVAAEIFADKAQCSGLFFALPTQATSNAMFSRLLAWTQALDLPETYGIKLAHGKAQFNADHQALLEGSRGIGETPGDAVVHQWFEGNKKALLSDFVVGTIDQFLLAALRQKHVMLRHLGLAGKVVILDECHAYDSYMNNYLDCALAWMGAYGVPVIVLSATLPAARRAGLVRAYLGQRAPDPVRKRPGRAAVPPPPEPEWTRSRAYPLLTWTNGQAVQQQEVMDAGPSRNVSLARMEDADLITRLDSLLCEGGYAGVIVNTVQRAQDFARELRKAFGEDQVILTHARFTAPDRIRTEERLLQLLGKPRDGKLRSGRYIVVGTQVLEQSLDLDFDVLVSDLCPMDLLLQRMGRLHRHQRPRPANLQTPLCLVMGAQGDILDPGAQAVYMAYPLLRTLAFLPQDGLTLPEDISPLVQDVYSEDVPMPHPVAGYEEARREWLLRVSRQEGRSGTYLIKKPDADDALTDWMAEPPGDALGEASVRDAGDSLEVLVVCKAGGDGLSLLPWAEDNPEVGVLSAYHMPGKEQARLLARQSLRLPPTLCHPGIIKETISALEQENLCLSAWQQSPWLKGQLFLILNEGLETTLVRHRLTYTQQLGLLCEKEGREHEGEGV